MAFETEPTRKHILTAEEIWAADDIKEELVDVPEWGGQVRVRALTLAQIANVAQRSVKRNPRTNQDETDRELSVAMTLIEGMIEPKVTWADYPKLRERSATAVTRIVQAINALGPTSEAIDEADKRIWPELNPEIPVRVGPRVGNDVEPSHNGNVNG